MEAFDAVFLHPNSESPASDIFEHFSFLMREAYAENNLTQDDLLKGYSVMIHVGIKTCVERGITKITHVEQICDPSQLKAPFDYITCFFLCEKYNFSLRHRPQEVDQTNPQPFSNLN